MKLHGGSECKYLERCLAEGCIACESPICRYECEDCYIYQHREAQDKDYSSIINTEEEDYGT